jgi:hypothetical protein
MAVHTTTAHGHPITTCLSMAHTWRRPTPSSRRCLPARPFSPSIFLDRNRRDIGKSQSLWTDSKMKTAGSRWRRRGSMGRAAPTKRPRVGERPTPSVRPSARPHKNVWKTSAGHTSFGGFPRGTLLLVVGPTLSRIAVSSLYSVEERSPRSLKVRSSPGLDSPVWRTCAERRRRRAAGGGAGHHRPQTAHPTPRGAARRRGARR